MADAPATPPKFVPTLTDEVMLPDAQEDVQEDHAHAEPAEQGAALTQGYELPSAVADDDDDLPLAEHSADMAASPHASAVSVPPDSVPLLEEEAVVPYLSPPLESVPPIVSDEPLSDVTPMASPNAAPATVLPDGYEEYVIHRVMQRVDVMLEKRLREAIATVIQEQTRSIVPRLREEVESVVRQSVYEAVADELAGSSLS